MEEQLDLNECEKHGADLKGQILGSQEAISASPISSAKEGIAERQHLKLNFASVTPEKASETCHMKCEKEAELLPHKYRTLLDFLDRMASSLRLLALCKKPPTFHNVSRQVEIFTGRKFEHKHLAQIKHVLPEAVKIDKILVHNAENLCMHPEMKITLTFDIVEGCHEESIFVGLRHLLASRLRSFLDKNSEACDIPEAVLPVTYSQEDAIISTDPLPVDVLTSTRTEAVKSSHFCPSYAPRFVERTIGDESERMRLNAVPLPSSSSIGDEIATERISVDSCSKPTFNRNPANSSPQRVSSSTFKSTPLKFVSESDSFMLETPAQSTPKRSSSTSERKHKTLITQTCMSCNQTAKRSLDFSKLDEEESSLDLNTSEIDQTKNIPNTSTQTEMKGKTVSGASVTPCEDEANICHSGMGDKINQFCLHVHQQTSVSLSELVISIQRIFQSANRHAMTKEELIHKIIMNCEFDEKGQIEQQIEILENLVPDWICKTVVPSGDLLYSIEKVSDLNSILKRVAMV